MKKIVFENEHRKKHFAFFSAMNHPHFNICANVDITVLLEEINHRQLSFTPTIAYLVSKVANHIKEFRWRIRTGEVWEHEVVHPSFSVYTEQADVFSFCEVPFHPSFENFYGRAIKKIELMKVNPSFEDEENRDDYLFLSSIPWVSFTGFQHAMSYHPTDSVPRITWGKYFKEGDKVKMPLSVQAHHALVDGRHSGRFFQLFEEFSKELLV